MKLKYSLLSFAFLAFSLSSPSLAAPMPASINKLKEQIKQSMEAHLRNSLGRSPVNFDLEVTADSIPPKCTRCGTYYFRLPPALRLDRDTVFNGVTLKFKDEQAILSGQVYSSKERDLLVQAVSNVLGKPTVELKTFPYDAVGNDYGITTGQSDLYVLPKVEAGDNLATQARLGTPVKILQYSSDKKFALVRVEDDGYIAWIQRKNLHEGAQNWYQAWLNGRSVLVMSAIQSPMSLPVGTRLRFVKDLGTQIQAALPNNKVLTLSKSQVVLNQPGKMPNPNDLLITAKHYLPKGPEGGGTYLWGGTYGKRLDCSGFVQTVYRMHGVYLPRDADQQKAFTQRVGSELKSHHELKAGDLVFFSGNRKYATHVGMYIGNHQVIHSSAKGPYNGIKISTLQGGDDYDKYLQSIYFGGGRVTRSL